MNRLALFLMVGVALLLIASPARAAPLVVYYRDGPQDPLLVPQHVHELGDLAFPPEEEIVSTWQETTETACFEPGNEDDPGIPNVLVTMTNLTPTTWYDVWYVADPETALTNMDGLIGNLGLGDARRAFRIDSVGLKRRK